MNNKNELEDQITSTEELEDLGDLDDLNDTDDLDDTDNLDDMDDRTEEPTRNSKRSKKSKRFQLHVLSIILVIAIVVFGFSAYKLISYYLEYKQGDDIYHNIQNEVLDEDATTAVIQEGDDAKEVEVPFRYDHNALLAINEEGIGYFYMPSIDARYPMVQTTNNDFYLDHTFNKTSNKNGCLFEDNRIKGGITASHVIIYGHNMKNGSMFGKLNRYKDQAFWSTEGNDVFYLYTQDKMMEYRIFSVYISEPVSDTYTFNFSSLDLMRSYAQARKSESLYDTGVDLSNATQVVTLSTCTDKGDQRLIVHGVYVGEAQLDN